MRISAIMGDDLDDLLNSVEKSFNIDEKSSKSGQTSRLQRRSTEIDRKSGDSTSKKAVNDVSDILDDPWLDDIEGVKNHRREMKSRKSVPNVGATLSSSLTSSSAVWQETKEHKRLQQSSSCMKCLTVYIGGSDAECGICTSVSKRTCDKLRCTDCDFMISMFNDYKWRDTTDYLFLRNNMPDLARLKPNLVRQNGWRAYACQCQWYNANQQISLPSGLKWVCAKH